MTAPILMLRNNLPGTAGILGKDTNLQLSIVDSDGRQGAADFGPADGDRLVAASRARDIDHVSRSHHLPLRIQLDARRSYNSPYQRL